MAETLPFGSVRKTYRCVLKAALFASAASLSFSPSAYADAPPLLHDMYGSVGLIDMPSARMAPDGQLSFSAAYLNNNQRYNLGFQAFPWLEVDFRYSGLTHFNPSYPVYWDRSFALKARLWNEGPVLPAIAVGIDDLIGTGVYGGEYVVASKQFGDVDASIGMGWGRLGTANTTRNPLGAISNSFYDRRGGFAGLGGDFNIKQYFRGPHAGIFGGLAWRTPINGVTLLAETSSDDYAEEARTGNFKPRNQFNFGASYQATNTMTMSLNWLYGKRIGGNLSLALDPTTKPYPQKIGTPPPLPPVTRTTDEQLQALRVMLYGREAVADDLNTARTAKNDMVDLLWRQKGVENIDIRGQTLELTVSSKPSGMQCLDITHVLQSYESDLTTVELTATGGNIPVRCAAPAAPDNDFQNGIFVGKGTRSSGAIPIQSVTTIDARPSGKADKNLLLRNIKADAKKQSITILAIQFIDSEAFIYYANSHYFSEADALDRLTAILMKNAPPNIERFRLISVTDGVPRRQFNVLRTPQERLAAVDGRIDIFKTNSTESIAPPLYNPILARASRGTYPRFSWSIYPQFRQELFDPANPLGVQFVAAAGGVAELFPGFALIGQVETDLYNNYNKIRTADSVLPHVRTDQVQYLIDGKNGIGALEADYSFRLASDVSAVARAGYLESMFGGAGGEILWRPENQRWSLGFDGYEVWQRNFNRLFGFQSYKTFTGHVSLYYASPWYNINFALRAGQYLAGDRGVTLEVTRRFASGVEIGAFATKTNVSAQQFGEGSFDKGILIRIPLGWGLPLETQGEFDLDLRSIQRDGGQRLFGDTQLYETTRRSSQAEILNARGEASGDGW